jgi:hypothetical protein
MGMEERNRGFSLYRAVLEGTRQSRAGGLSEHEALNRRSPGVQRFRFWARDKRAEFRSADKTARRMALKILSGAFLSP